MLASRGLVLALTTLAQGVLASASHLTSCSVAHAIDTRCMLDALKADGAVVLSGIRALSSAREEALCAIAECASQGDDPKMREVELADGSTRRSFGTTTVHGVPLRLSASTCPTLDDSTATLRAIVDQTSRRFLAALEPLVGRSKPLLSSRAGKTFSTLSEVAHFGDQLEHFHTYAPPWNRSLSDSHTQEAVPLHTDAGLFIAFVPALYLEHAPTRSAGCQRRSPNSPPQKGNERASGFYVQRADGTRATIDPAVEDDAVVYALGEGWAQWLSPKLSRALHAAPHAMVLRGSDETRRVWYGRMFLPPDDALLPSRTGEVSDETFGEWRDRTADQVHRKQEDALEAAATAAMPAACTTPSRRILTTADSDSCGPNDLFCWRQCLPSDCGHDAVCLDAGTGASVDPADHCTSCVPYCLPPAPPGQSRSPPPPPRPAQLGFCTGLGTVMHMSGFKIGGDDCVNYLFVSWTLDSEGAFAGAVIGSFALAIATEALTWFRREWLRKHKALKKQPALYRFLMGFAFMIQVTLGYVLMLIAMTYQAELFIAVIVGLALGHTLLNVAAPVSERSDACCVEPIEKSKSRRTAPAGRADPGEGKKEDCCSMRGG